MKKIPLILIIAICCVAGITLFLFVNHPDDNPVTNGGSSTQTDDTPGIISGENISVFSTLIGNITIGIPVPESPSTIALYRGYFREGDLVEKRFRSFKSITNPIPAQQAPDVAKTILEQYGGLPDDARLLGSGVSYADLINLTTDKVEARIPQCTYVSWYRTIDGMEIKGNSDTVQVELGENGELNRIYKSWRTYNPVGNVSIISASKAIQNLLAGEVLNPASDIYHQDVSIHSIRLSYYIQGVDNPEVTLEPIWVFNGETESGEYLPFYVYARQFANFTATPTRGKVPLTVTFTDTSDASPVKWLWEFGDGTNSTGQNPSHTYTTAGTYNVSLRAWNDLGSDTMEKPFFIAARDRD